MSDLKIANKLIYEVLNLNHQRVAEIDIDVLNVFLTNEKQVEDGIFEFIKKLNDDREIFFSGFFAGWIAGLSFGIAYPDWANSIIRDYTHINELAKANKEYAIRKLVDMLEVYEKSRDGNLKKIVDERRDVV
jgi:hypothetical protein